MKISNQEDNTKRLCDFCSKSTAILYCKADSAKLCFACDREVHSTNQLFTKHTRSLLCDACDSSPASILCSTDSLVLCQNCDWETHGRLGSVHDRRPIEGFIGCPTVCELCAIVGFEDLGSKKALFFGEESGDYGFEDLLVWETPTIFSLDDLIGSSNDNHGFRAMGVPPLPKNRNATCGLHKEEILRQLREMATMEPDMKVVDVKPLTSVHPLVPEQNLQPRDMYIGCEHKANYGFVFPAYEASAFHLCCDNAEGANQFTHSSVLGSYNDEESCLVPDKHSHADDIHQEQSHHDHPLVSETLAFIPKVPVYEYNSQERDTALTRYKEKKKNRRYDRHIRYESRKARAESRTRIKGRFAKIEH